MACYGREAARRLRQLILGRQTPSRRNLLGSVRDTLWKGLREASELAFMPLETLFTIQTVDLPYWERG